MRNDQAVRFAEMICRVIGGKARRLEDFADIHKGLSKKTANRDLEALAAVTSLQIVVYKRDGIKYYRSDAGLLATDPPMIRCGGECGQLKPKELFWKDKSRRTGRRKECITCERRIRAERRKRDRKKLNAQARVYRKRNRKSYNQYQHDYYSRNHVKVRRSKYGEL